MESAKNTAESAKNAAQDAAESAKNKAQDAAESAKNTASDALDSAKDKAQDAVDSARNAVGNLVGNVVPSSSQQPIEPQTDAHTLKSRLEWANPGFTILDVSDRQTYNQGHIMGAMAMPLEDLAQRAKSSLQPTRDIYVYGENDGQASQAAQTLRSSGFVNVSELKGGLAAWKAVGGPTEGIIESRTPAGADDYNVVARLQNHAETQKKDV